MNILLVHSRSEVANLLTLPLESRFSATVTCATDSAQMLDLLVNKKLNPDLLVAQNSQALLDPLAAAAAQMVSPLNLILCDGTHLMPDKPPAKLNVWGVANPATLLPDLVELIQKNHAGAAKAAKPGDDGRYCRIHTSLLIKMIPLAADVYIRLSATHYTKMFSREDTFDEADRKRFNEKKKLEFLYLRNEDCPVFVDKLCADLDKMLKENPLPPPEEVNDTMGATIEAAHELIEKFGVTEEVQKVVKSSMDVAIKSMGDFPNLADILKNVTNHQGKYIGHHSMLLTNLACALAVAMDWYSESTFQKLTMAAFLHDAPLRDHELCAVKTLDQFDKELKGKFTLAQIQEYKGHPQRAVLMLGAFKEIPAETDKIILQHHEHPMGSGFPNQLTSNYISPLASLFIIAHDLTDYVIDNGKLDAEDFLTQNLNKYSTGNFKKIAKVIASVTLN